MRQQDDSAYVGAALRHSFARHPAPCGLATRVMAAVRSSGDDAVRPPARRRYLPRWTLRSNWALASGAVAAALLLSLAGASWQARRSASRLAMEGAERELAEVLHLAGRNWNRAQEAALSPLREDQE